MHTVTHNVGSPVKLRYVGSNAFDTCIYSHDEFDGESMSKAGSVPDCVQTVIFCSNGSNAGLYKLLYRASSEIFCDFLIGPYQW